MFYIFKDGILIEQGYTDEFIVINLKVEEWEK